MWPFQFFLIRRNFRLKVLCGYLGMSAKQLHQGLGKARPKSDGAKEICPDRLRPNTYVGENLFFKIIGIRGDAKANELAM